MLGDDVLTGGERIKAWLKSRHFKLGIPTLIFVVGGSFILSTFYQSSVDHRNRSGRSVRMTREEYSRLNREQEMKKKLMEERALKRLEEGQEDFDLDHEYEKLLTSKYQNDYTMVRIPRYGDPSLAPAGNAGRVNVKKFNDDRSEIIDTVTFENGKVTN